MSVISTLVRTWKVVKVLNSQGITKKSPDKGITLLDKKSEEQVKSQLGEVLSRERRLSWVHREPISFLTCIPGAGACSEHRQGAQRLGKNEGMLVQFWMPVWAGRLERGPQSPNPRRDRSFP